MIMMKRTKLLSVALATVVFVAIGVTSSQQAAPKRAHVVILGTTDMHGRIFPIDYYTNKYDNVGIAKVATLVKEARKNDPDLLLVDSGDTIQGTPLEYFHNKRNNTPPDPMMLAMNALHYDSMTVGNHEYNFGLQVLEQGAQRSTVSLSLSEHLRHKEHRRRITNTLPRQGSSGRAHWGPGIDDAGDSELGERAELRGP